MREFSWNFGVNKNKVKSTLLECVFLIAVTFEKRKLR